MGMRTVVLFYVNGRAFIHGLLTGRLVNRTVVLLLQKSIGAGARSFPVISGVSGFACRRVYVYSLYISLYALFTDY
jgi:hypothetical protein